MTLGPEWNPVLIVLAVLAGLLAAALWNPWAGIVGIAVVFWVLVIYAFLHAP